MISLNLIKSCLRGDKRAYKLLYEATVPYTYSIVKRYISNMEDRKDVVQEVYAKVFTRLDTFDVDKGEFKFWLRKITVNESLMFLRKEANMKLHVFDQYNNTPDPNSTDVIDKLTRDDILVLLDKMPVRYKAVFLAYIIDGYDHTEIGKMLNISKDTSRSQLSRAKQWLIKHIAASNKKKLYGLF